MIEKARQEVETNIRSSDKSEWTIEATWHWCLRTFHGVIHEILTRSEAYMSHIYESQGEPRGERDVIRLRNPTEDKRAFRRMLTSADSATKADSKVLWVILESREKNQNGVLRIGSELCRV